MTALVCFCTCPDSETASRIADIVVSEQLAACVNVCTGITSIYRWQGKLEHAQEVLLVIKTQRERVAALIDRIVTLHPYTVPEVIAVEVVAGAKPYLDWIEQQTMDRGA